MVLKPIGFCFFAIMAFGLLPVYFVFAQKSSPRISQETMKSFDEAFTELKDERDALKEEISQLKAGQMAMIDDFKKRLQTLEEEKQNNQKAQEAAEEKTASLEEEKAELTEKVEDAKFKIEKLNDLLHDKDSAAAELKKEKEELEIHWDRAESALEKAAVRIQKLQTENEQLKEEMRIGNDPKGRK